MEPISGLSQVMESLRRQLAESSARLEKGGRAGKHDAAAKNRAASVGAGPTLQKRIATKIRALNPDDPGWERKAGKLFLETVLLDEFGDQLMNDPSFSQLVDEIAQTIEGQAETKQKMAALVKSLAASDTV
jgi:hypothetical protein